MLTQRTFENMADTVVTDAFAISEIYQKGYKHFRYEYGIDVWYPDWALGYKPSPEEIDAEAYSRYVYQLSAGAMDRQLRRAIEALERFRDRTSTFYTILTGDEAEAPAAKWARRIHHLSAFTLGTGIMLYSGSIETGVIAGAATHLGTGRLLAGVATTFIGMARDLLRTVERARTVPWISKHFGDALNALRPALKPLVKRREGFERERKQVETEIATVEATERLAMRWRAQSQEMAATLGHPAAGRRSRPIGGLYKDPTLCRVMHDIHDDIGTVRREAERNGPAGLTRLTFNDPVGISRVSKCLDRFRLFSQRVRELSGNRCLSPTRRGLRDLDKILSSFRPAIETIERIQDMQRRMPKDCHAVLQYNGHQGFRFHVVDSGDPDLSPKETRTLAEPAVRRWMAGARQLQSLYEALQAMEAPLERGYEALGKKIRTPSNLRDELARQESFLRDLRYWKESNDLDDMVQAVMDQDSLRRDLPIDAAKAVDRLRVAEEIHRGVELARERVDVRAIETDDEPVMGLTG